MKYALNHQWKFRRAGYAAFCVALIQLLVAIITEFISITIICTSETYIDCVGNYVALACINDFDNNFFTYLSDHDVATLITEKKMIVGDLKVKLKDIFKIEVTSAYRPDESENDLVPELRKIKPIYTEEANGYTCPYSQRKVCGVPNKRAEKTMLSF